MIKPDVTNVWASSDTSDVIQPESSKVAQGWVKEIPPHQWFNWEMNRQGSFSAYVNGIGIPEWDSTTQYYANRSLINYNGSVYKCVKDNTNKAPDVETLYWVIYGFIGWRVVGNNYIAKPGDKIILNNRVEAQTLLLPQGVNFGDEVMVYPYPFTQYSKRKLTVDGGAYPIMGLNETMDVFEDNAVFSCKFCGNSVGWVVERMGTAGKYAKKNIYLGQSYGSGAARVYDVCIIDGAPLVMLVHDGNWTSGDKTDTNLEGGNYVLYFPEKYGFSFAAINYTLATASVESYPTAVDDIIAAATHIASTYGVNFIHLVGAGAGANLAALAAIKSPTTFKSFIGYYGMYDLTNTAQIDASIQPDIADFTSTPADASPLLLASSLTIPAYLVHGQDDALVNVQQTLDFATALNVVPDIVTGTDGAHGFRVFGDYTALSMPSFAQRVFNFIDKIGE